MNPTPSENPNPATVPISDGTVPSLADTLANQRKHLAPSNRRASASPASRVYSAMLIASTLVAAGFCMLYITKPVIVTPPDGDMPAAEAALARAPDSQVEPEVEDLGETNPPSPASPASAEHADHEETNLRVQHVLNATTPDGDLSRIVLDVPVIYASRNLRWTEAEVAHARAIHARLADYHEQSHQLRELGAGILAEWNGLIERSIPAADLRADSPSLPANQEDAARLPRPAILDTTEVIEIKPPGE